MTLSVHVADHPDVLVGQLCDLLAKPLDDPLAPELVAVPTRGIERWLTQRIASELGLRGAGDGVCANVRFPSPHDLVHGVLRSVPDLAASAEAWHRPALVAALVEAIDTNVDQPWMRLIARHLDGPGDVGAAHPDRLPVARKVARLFDGYARRRPTMIGAWAAGRFVDPDGGLLSEDSVWQARLFGAVRERIGVPSLPEVLSEGLGPVRSGAVELDLPPRLGMYGLTGVDPLDLDVLEAVATHREVHLFVLHPSPALWRSCAQRVEPGRRELPRGEDTTAALPNHAILRSWGQDSRELQVVLGHRAITAEPAVVGLAPPTTLLHRLQHDVRANLSATLDRALSAAVANGDDRSIQVHVCHGPRRQVEVLRDAILHLLAADPTLEARDVVVMTPDLATFAPLIEAAFPAGSHHPVDDALPDLRVRIADRSPTATNPLVRFAATVLELADSRVEASALRQLVTQPAVQQRFGFDAEVAGEIVDLIDDTAVAWGIDGVDRERWGAGSNQDRTWRQALDRALTGVFYADSPVRLVAGVAPLDGVEGQDATPVGLLAALVDRIAAIRRLLDRPQPMSAWATSIATAVRLLAAPGWDEEWQWAQLGRLLTETFPAPAATGLDPSIGLAEARRAASAWLDDRPSPLHFRTGDVTVCTMVPMRSVPYRVVCLLGMDDDRFPRSSRGDGDDLLVDHEMVGDHDRGSEDRQLLLDAVMAAGDHLVVTYSGHDQLTNAAYPPAVPIAELVDTAAAIVGDAAMASIVTEHPLQSFAARNFLGSQLGLAGPWGFDPMQFAGAVAAHGRHAPATPQPATWPAVDPQPMIALDDLVAFLVHPAGRFAKARLGFSIPKPGDVPDDTLPADLRGLAAWAVTDRILTGLLAGHDLDALATRERHSGALPAGELGADDLATSVDAARSLWDAARDRGYAPERQRPWPGSVRIGERLVEGSVLADADQAQLVTITPSRLKGKPRLRAFVELAFLTAIEPEIPWTAVLLGRRADGDGHKAVTLGALGPTAAERGDHALRLITDLVALYDEGQVAPLPIPCETAYIWQRRVNNNPARAFNEANETWAGRFPERDDVVHSLLLAHPDLDALLETAFADYAARLWEPIIAITSEKPL